MARTLDLDKVKEAWQLRRQGNQQRDIAEALHLSLRHVQNYLSLDWLAQRGLRVLMKGGAEEANEQLRILWDLGEETVDNGAQETNGSDEAGTSPGQAKRKRAPVCRSPKDWPDVARLASWGVPRYDAPGLLSAWRRAHREEAHHICAFWGELTDNVQRGIPFADAYDLAIASWLADRWGFKLLKTITELYCLYRPWEGKVHRKVYLEEVQVAIDEHREDGSNLNGTVPGELGSLFGELPRRFLYGLPRRMVMSGHYQDMDDDDDDDN